MSLCRAASTVRRSVVQWNARAAALRQAIEEHESAQRDYEGARHRREPVASRLATLEDSIGLEYSEVVAAIATSTADLDAAASAHETLRTNHLDLRDRRTRLATELEQAQADVETANRRCVEQLGLVRRTLAVPGLLGAARTETKDSGQRADIGASGPATSGADLATTDDADAATGLAIRSVSESPDGLRELVVALRDAITAPQREVNAESLRQSLRQRRDGLGAGWDAEDRQPNADLPLSVEVTGPLGRMALPEAVERVEAQLRSMSSLLSSKQDQALRNLLQGLIAKEVAEKLHAARELVALMNKRLDSVTTSHGIGVSLRWTRRDDIDETLASTIGLLSKRPDLRTTDEDRELIAVLSERIAGARREDPDAPYRQLIGQVLDYRTWYQMGLVLRRPGQPDERLSRRTALSEGEKKVVSYLPLFAAVAASCDALAESASDTPRFVLLDDAFAKVSEDNHPKLFGLLVELDLDFIATSERLWGTHSTVPELAITEVIRDADLGVIVLEHARWDGRTGRITP